MADRKRPAHELAQDRDNDKDKDAKKLLLDMLRMKIL